MDTSMHGKIPVDVLFPDFRLPEDALSPEDWARLAFKLHAELTGFYASSGHKIGSIPRLLEQVNPSIRDSQLLYGHAKVMPCSPDDSRCESKTKGAIFASCMQFGRVPSAQEWQWVKSPRSTKPKDVKLPSARRTVHLFISQKGFFIVVVRWIPNPGWSRNLKGEYYLGHDCCFRAVSIVITEASELQLASFLRNHQKNSSSGSWSRNVVATLLHIQEDVVKHKLEEYDEAVASMHRIKPLVGALS